MARASSVNAAAARLSAAPSYFGHYELATEAAVPDRVVSAFTELALAV